LVELRAASQCGGAVHVPVVPFDDNRVGATWEAAGAMRAHPRRKCVSARCATSFVAQQNFDIVPI